MSKDKKLPIREAARNVLLYVARRHGVEDVEDFSCPHMRALATSLGKGWRPSENRGKYDRLLEELERDECWKGKYFFFAARDKTYQSACNPSSAEYRNKCVEVFLIPKWTWERGDAFPKEGYFRHDLPHGLCYWNGWTSRNCEWRSGMYSIEVASDEHEDDFNAADAVEMMRKEGYTQKQSIIAKWEDEQKHIDLGSSRMPRKPPIHTIMK